MKLRTKIALLIFIVWILAIVVDRALGVLIA